MYVHSRTHAQRNITSLACRKPALVNASTHSGSKRRGHADEMTAPPPLYSKLRNSQLIVRNEARRAKVVLRRGRENCERHSVRSPSGIRPWVRHPGRSAQCLPASPCLAIACLSPPPKASSHSSSACRVPSVALRLTRVPGRLAEPPNVFLEAFFFFSEKRPRDMGAEICQNYMFFSVFRGRWYVVVCS